MGEGGFEPPATWSQTRNHTKLDHPPVKIEGKIDNICSDNENQDHKLSNIRTQIFIRFLIFLFLYPTTIVFLKSNKLR